MLAAGVVLLFIASLILSLYTIYLRYIVLCFQGEISVLFDRLYLLGRRNPEDAAAIKNISGLLHELFQGKFIEGDLVFFQISLTESLHNINEDLMQEITTMIIDYERIHLNYALRRSPFSALTGLRILVKGAHRDWLGMLLHMPKLRGIRPA